MSKLSEALEAGELAVTCELNPPKGTDLAPLLAKADSLAGHVHAFNLTDSHASLMAMAPIGAAVRLLERGCEPVLQLTTRDRNRIALQGDLLAAAALGVENVVFMGGDPPANGDHPDAKPVFDVFASQIIAAARGLTEGHDMAGHALHGAPRLFLGAVVNPGAADLDAELRRMEEKLEAGARFFQTQAVYDPARFERFARAAERLEARLLAGVIPLKSARQAAWMNEHVPGIEVPDALAAEIEGAADREAASVALAARIIRAVRPLCHGLHVMPIGWERLVPRILEEAGIG